MKISVIIPAYNCSSTIVRTLDSINHQTVKPDEIVIVDDGSTDNTAAVIKEYSSQVPISYFYQENKRQAAARNLAVSKAKFDWLAFLDSDDVWLPKYIETQVSRARANPKLEAIIGNYELVEGQKNRKFIPEVIAGKDFSPSSQLASNFFCFMVTLLKKEKFLEVGGFDESFRNAEDVDLGFRLTKTCRYQVFPQPVLARYLRRPGSSSHQEAHDINGLKRLYKKVLKRTDLTEEERNMAQEKLGFWLLREELFIIRKEAILHGQFSGLRKYIQMFGQAKKTLRFFGLGLILVLPGSIRYLKATRWQNLDLED